MPALAKPAAGLQQPPKAESQCVQSWQPGLQRAYGHLAQRVAQLAARVAHAAHVARAVIQERDLLQLTSGMIAATERRRGSGGGEVTDRAGGAAARLHAHLGEHGRHAG